MNSKISSYFFEKYIWLLLALIAVVLFYASFTSKKVAPKYFAQNDVVLILDVSKSMLAADVAPNRLQQALKVIDAFIDNTNLNKIAIITFSKLPNMLMPLTANKTILHNTLKQINNNDAQTTSDVNGALNLAISIINGYEATNNNVVVFTDGELQVPIKPEIVAVYKKLNITLNVNIIGTSEGANIIDNNSNDFVKDKNNKIVNSKINENSFDEIVQATSGNVYLNNAIDKLTFKLADTIIKVKERDFYFKDYFWLFMAMFFLILEYILKFIKKPKYIYTALILIGMLQNNVMLYAQNYSSVDAVKLEQLIKNKNIIDAQLYLKKASGSDTLCYHMYNAILLQRFNKPNEALTQYEMLLDKTDSNTKETIIFNKALIYFTQKKYSQCMEQCKWLLLKNFNNTDARLLLQKALRKNKVEQKENRENKKDEDSKDKLPPKWETILQQMNADEQKIKKAQFEEKGKKWENNW